MFSRALLVLICCSCKVSISFMSLLTHHFVAFCSTVTQIRNWAFSLSFAPKHHPTKHLRMEQIFLQDWGCGWDGEAAAGEATEHLHHSTEQQTALNFNIKHPRPYKSFDRPPPHRWWFSACDIARPLCSCASAFPALLWEPSLVLSSCSFKPERWWEGAKWEQKRDTYLSK